MTIDIESLTGRGAVTSRRVYTRRDASLYAQSIGFGSDPLDELELDFVSDRPTFKSVPTMASIFADVILELTHACQLQHPELALHGEQKLEIFSPLPDMAELEIQGSIAAVYDRGPQRGAEIHMSTSSVSPGITGAEKRTSKLFMTDGSPSQ